MTTILRAIVGSTAYGLDRKGSDVDRLGIFVAPTIAVAGLSWHPSRETRSKGADWTEHEIGKFLRLTLGMNPTLTEVLWLPEDAYEVMTPLGVRLRMLRHAFLSEKAVRNAYGGYARQQAVKLAQRGDGSFSADTRKRTAKHGRHLLRLLRQGRQLLTTGDLTVHVGDPTDYFAFDSMTPDEMLDVYEREDALFREARSVLPAQPDREKITDLLDSVRISHLTRQSVAQEPAET